MSLDADSYESEAKFDFEVGIIGSGFGGSIAAIELAKVFNELEPNPDRQKRVCILERGVWNISPEGWRAKNDVAKLIYADSRPYQFWAQPDSSRGLLNLFGMLRTIPYVTGYLKLFGKSRINYRGLYDMKNYDGNFAIVASGVGGGSLIYSGVIAAPEPEILDKPYSDGGLKPWKPQWKITYAELEPYMMYAKYNFIGVDKIYSIQSGYSDKEWMVLPKTKALRKAASITKDELEKDGDFDIAFKFADLAMTEAPTKHGKKDEPLGFCKRQGRCNLGCLPGARHTLNKKLADALRAKLPIIVRELAEVIHIEPINCGKGGYWIEYLDHGLNQKNLEDDWWHFRGHRDFISDHRIKKNQRHKKKRILVRTLVLAAGTYGTTGLLLRSKHQSPLSWEFTGSVGKRFSLNGDHFGFTTPTSEPVYPTEGPIDTASVLFKRKGSDGLFTIEDATIPRMVASIFATLIETHVKIIGKTRKRNLYVRKISWRYPRLAFELLLAWNEPRKVFRVMKKFIGSSGWFPANEGVLAWVVGSDGHQKRGSNPKPPLGEFSDPDELEEAYRVSKVFFFACMGVDRADGEAVWNSKIEELDFKWKDLEKDKIYSDIKEGMALLGRNMVSSTTSQRPKEEWMINDPMDQLFSSPKKRMTIHPIGGCPMETCDEAGAVDTYGRLLKNGGSYYQNLYIVDGSIIPTALGINPSLTISGLAFRIVDKIVRTNYNATPVLKKVVVVGKKYLVTIREFSKSPALGLAVGTDVKELDDPDNTEDFDNIVYVEGPDPRNLVRRTDDLTSLPKPIQVCVTINRIEGRVAWGSL